MSKILWFDCETTGFDPKINSIIEMSGIIEVGGKEKERFTFKCKPVEGDVINEESLAFRNITKKEIMLYPDISETKEKISQIFDSHINKYDKFDKFILGGYNVRFDFDFLLNFFTREGDDFLGSYIRFQGLLDAFPIVQYLNMMNMTKMENSKLETVAKYFNIPHTAHDSFSDIEVSRDLMYLIAKNLEWKYNKKGE